MLCLAVVFCCAVVSKMALCFQSTDPAVTKRASMIGDMFLKNIRQKCTIQQQTDEARQKLNVTVAFLSADHFLFMFLGSVCVYAHV